MASLETLRLTGMPFTPTSPPRSGRVRGADVVLSTLNGRVVRTTLYLVRLSLAGQRAGTPPGGPAIGVTASTTTTSTASASTSGGGATAQTNALWLGRPPQPGGGLEVERARIMLASVPTLSAPTWVLSLTQTDLRQLFQIAGAVAKPILLTSHALMTIGWMARALQIEWERLNVQMAKLACTFTGDDAAMEAHIREVLLLFVHMRKKTRLLHLR